MAINNDSNVFQEKDFTNLTFSNEYRTKTNYTYADNYADYLKEPYNNFNKIQLPNLCRRGLRSPPNMIISNSSKSSDASKIYTHALSVLNKSSLNSIFKNKNKLGLKKNLEKFLIVLILTILSFFLLNVFNRQEYKNNDYTEIKRLLKVSKEKTTVSKIFANNENFIKIDSNNFDQLTKIGLSNTKFYNDCEHVSFEDVKRYIKKLFKVYNADKTGMVDFASELAGGRILFTKCAETYYENKRWFSLYNIPIYPIIVSPRVVIQVKTEFSLN